MSKFKTEKQNFYHELRNWEGRRARFKFSDGRIVYYKIHRVEPNKFAFIVKVGSEKELIFATNLESVKPVRDGDIIDGVSRRKDYKAAATVTG